MNVIPITWVRAEKYCEVSGVTLYTLQELIREGAIAATKHYKRTGPRTLWVNLEQMNKWVESQPHVESLCPQASKSARAKPAQACG